MAKVSRLTKFGNDLYTGDRSYAFVGHRWTWYIIAAVLLAIMVAGTVLRGGFEFGIEFRGGSEFTVSSVTDTTTSLAEDAVISVVEEASAQVTVVGGDSIRVVTELLSDQAQAEAVREALATAYDVPVEQVTTTFIDATWGADVSRQGIIALIVFVVLAALFMAVYFRTWKMSVAAIVSLMHDIVITVGVYGIFGFEITPSAIIGFLTILGYSLYDTVVVFDKVRENTLEATPASAAEFAAAVNLGVNQTLVRSINTGVVAVLPVAAILWIGAYVLGAGTLRDIALALFIGIIVGTYSTVFIGAPFYSGLREGEFFPVRSGTTMSGVSLASLVISAGALIFVGLDFGLGGISPLVSLIALFLAIGAGLVAIGLGHYGLHVTRVRQQRGRDLAIGGLLLGYTSVLALSVPFLMWLTGVIHAAQLHG